MSINKNISMSQTNNLTFDPTDERCPPALVADLVWAWPLILLLLALNILIGWLIHHQN